MMYTSTISGTIVFTSLLVIHFIQPLIFLLALLLKYVTHHGTLHVCDALCTRRAPTQRGGTSSTDKSSRAEPSGMLLRWSSYCLLVQAAALCPRRVEVAGESAAAAAVLLSRTLSQVAAAAVKHAQYLSTKRHRAPRRLHPCGV